MLGAVLVTLSLGLAMSCSENVREPAPSDRGDLGPVDALARRFGRVRRRMSSRGYGRATALSRAFIAEGRGRVFPLRLPAERCTTMVALGGGTLEEVDVRLYDARGELLATDGVSGPAGLVHVCPLGEGRVSTYLTLTGRGIGAVVAAAYESEASAGEGFDALFDGAIPPASPFEPVEEALRSMSAPLIERGLSELGEPRFARLAAGQEARAPLSLAANTCVVLVGRSDLGIEDLDLHLFDGHGGEVARDLGVEGEPQIEYCTREAFEGSVAALAFAGAGTAGWSAWVRPFDEPDEPGESSPPAVRSLEVLSDALLERGFVADERVETGRLAPGQTESFDIERREGCGWIVATADDPTLDLDLYLYSNEALLDRDVRVQPSARVGVCGSAASYRVVVKGYGSGTFTLASFSGPPAMNRLAQLRADEGAAALVARGFVRERKEHLQTADAERVVTVDEGCIALVAGGSAGVHDLDLAVFAADGEERIASDTGPAPWASATICAEGEAITRRVRISAYRGSGSAELRWLVRP